jgi:hypothetical protein
MKKRIPPFDGIEYTGDWHTMLTNALHLAEQTTSLELLQAIRDMQSLLEKNDECNQTVTITMQVPDDIRIDKVISGISSSPYAREASIELIEPRLLALTLLKRGSQAHVQQYAEWLIFHGINDARPSVTSK